MSRSTARPAARGARTRRAKKLPPADSRIPIANAGLVLVGPYLPAFFRRLGLFVPGDGAPSEWRSPSAQDRAVQLLQWLVEERCDRPGPMLALNNLLCGRPPDHPTVAAIEPSEEELATCRSLLDAIVAAWPMMKGSSVEALRETFLQRSGRISRIEAGWRIAVERKTLDVLVDQLPWSISMIFHRWMREPVSVTW